MLIDINKTHQLAQQFFNQGNYQQSYQHVISILNQDKFFADGYFLLGLIASVHGNNEKAIQLIQQAQVLEPENIEYLAQLAKHCALTTDHVAAVRFANIAADLINQGAISTAINYDTLGVAYSQAGLHNKAVIFFQKAVALAEKNQTKNAEFYFNLGASLKFIGDFSAAKQAYFNTINLQPLHCKAHGALSSLGGISEKNNHIATLKELLQSSLSVEDQLHIAHALAREYEAFNEYDQAFQSLFKAKENKRKTLNYFIEDDRNMFSSLHNVFAKPESFEKVGHDSSEALFVVGMPRTGTTLVERILSQHSDVTSAGELQHFGLLLKKMAKTETNRVIDSETIDAACKINFAELGRKYIESTRAITGKTAKFVDKMPLNILYAGFILQALPNAKIICLDRNPLDTIVSNFRQLFAVNFSYYNYSYSLEDTTEFYLMFKQLAEFWLVQYPESFYFINYEKLVNNPEVEAKKMVEFCGLTWQENCLAINDNKAPVATASALQVRQPINNKSVGNWKKYEGHLDKVKALLDKNTPT